MEILDGSTTTVNYSNVFSSIPAARNKYAGLGRSTAPAMLLVIFCNDVISGRSTEKSVQNDRIDAYKIF